jgi:hypothetical protein
MDIDLISFVIGTLLAIIGLIVAYYQWRETKDVERLRREQLLAQINRARYLIIPNEVIEIIVDKNDPRSEETLRQWIWSVHKGASDNYVQTVYFYLSTIGKFTFADLEQAKRAGVVTSNWEEDVWRSLIALREENRGKLPEDEFVLDRSNWMTKPTDYPKEETITAATDTTNG